MRCLCRDSAQTQALVAEAGGTMLDVSPVDLGDFGECQRWVDRAANEFGRIDILWNNASAGVFSTIEAMSPTDWDRSIRNELTLVTKAAWSQRGVNGGLIINTASVAGHGGSVAGIAHSATKWGVRGMTHVMAAEGAPLGIRAISVSPGVIETPGSSKQLSMPGVTEALMERSLIPRLGQPDDIARFVAFLASDGASSLRVPTSG
ncbi:SDR family NAD(P)-dependent oxidoreductase [Nocardioides immobilis]|uniref:SDR family NAD(P)-dependent oxidoreductase n=1 Tax=Nocardioides immobilis TaxID=2049295 RepID=UPI001C70F466|nr:SDR family oxidoreductase [Nocardioides immobilis]